METPADETLRDDIAECREGAFERLYDRFSERLFRAAHSITRRREDAEDVIQELFITLVRAGAGIREVRNLNAYLFTCVQRAAARRARQRDLEARVDLSLLEERPSPSPQAPEEGGSAPLSRALESLPLEQRVVISLKVDGELTFGEIGEALDISANTAASRYRYALEKLRTMLAGGANE